MTVPTCDKFFPIPPIHDWGLYVVQILSALSSEGRRGRPTVLRNLTRRFNSTSINVDMAVERRNRAASRYGTVTLDRPQTENNACTTNIATSIESNQASMQHLQHGYNAERNRGFPLTPQRRSRGRPETPTPADSTPRCTTHQAWQARASDPPPDLEAHMPNGAPKARRL